MIYQTNTGDQSRKGKRRSRGDKTWTQKKLSEKEIVDKREKDKDDAIYRAIYDLRKKTFDPRKRSATDLERNIEIYRTEQKEIDKTLNANLRALEEM